MAEVQVKQELVEQLNHPHGERKTQPSKPISDSGSVLSFNDKRFRVSSGAEGGLAKKKKMKKTRKQLDSILPLGFLDPLPPMNVASQLPKLAAISMAQPSSTVDKNTNRKVITNRSANAEGCK
ncbi:hypothetical protein U1Q18_032223 [Sarracenia purpurea var. burkii]